ncbi:MocR-like pyridoxine biosynthesis transcription factor PdxR [Paraburkholderia saeva]|uniref:MocR-like pyridoxine biosynthesis transcription factor PdxR n=1 Tax=Paraburkholderia saeva TaxID=2777537 RepID=UPI001D708C7E|nr:PLP-dependent aminotransferase family protein [Paraburkholderia saeva]CAG4889423.1 HTH-type transcriptional regulatory protein GabR [Paraburkholderia saeva]
MRRAEQIELALAPRPNGMSLQRWLYDELRAAILAGRLSRGARLPSSRDLAARFGLSRGTVLGVFSQLAAEGYLTGAVGRGSFVAPELPDRRLDVSDRPSTKKRDGRSLAQGGKEDTEDSAQSHGIALSTRGRLLARTAFDVSGRPGPARAFRTSQPDLDAFPFELWTRLAAKRTRRARRDLLGDGEAQGYRPLREAIAGYVGMSRGITCPADSVVVLNTVQQAIDLGARLLLDPGDAAWIEDPGYPGARFALEAAGARVIGVPVDAGGMSVEWARQHAPEARLAYVTAGRQTPLGPPLALERRLALLEWARDRGAIVIEDDYDSEYRFEGNPLAAMKSLDHDGHVIYCGTFSKVLFPALRTAYAILPDRLIDPFVAALSLTARHVPLDQQSVLHEFIADGHFGRHIRRMRMLYGERAEALKIAADRYLSGRLHVPRIIAGLDAPAFLPPGIDDADMARRAARHGVETRPLSLYAIDRPAPPGLVLGFASIDSDAIESGAIALARALEGLRHRP